MPRRIRASRASNTGPIRVEGLAELQRDLARFEPEIGKAYRKRVRKAVKNVADDARSRAPKRTGKLARGIKPRVTRTGAALESRADHARIQEFGGRHPVFGDREVWVNQPAQPHIFPAVQAGRPAVETESLAALDDATRLIGFR